MNAWARIGGATRAAVVAWLGVGVPYASPIAAETAAPSVAPEKSSAVEASAPSATTKPGANAQLTEARPLPNLSDELTGFGAELDKFRSGDAAAERSVRDAMDRLASRFGFEYLDKVVAFYAKLDPQDRKRGLETEIAWRAIRRDVLVAGRSEGITATRWMEMLPAILARLQAVIDAAQNAPDFSPAARAFALRAHLVPDRVINVPDLDEKTKARWIAEGRRDAERAIEMFERIGMVSTRLEPLTVLADLAFAEDKWSEAESGYEDVRQLARRYSNTEYEEHALRGLLRLARESGDLPRVSLISNELAAIPTLSGTWPDVKNHADYLLSLDEPEQAAEYLVRNKPARTTDLADWHLLMGGVLTRQGNAVAASAHYRALLEDANGTPIPGSEAWAADAERLLSEKNFDAALARLDEKPGLDKLGIVLRSNVLRIRGAALLGRGDARGAVDALESALRAGDAADSRLAGLRRTSSSVIGETVGLETVALLARARIDLGEAFTAALTIEDQQSRALRGALVPDRPLTLTRSDLIAWSNAYELGFVTWVIGADSSAVAYVARGGETTAVKIDISRKQIEEAVRRLREAATLGQTERCTMLASQIQAAILPSAILDRMPASPAADGARLLVCAHGPLERLPFDLLEIFSDAHTRRIVPVVLPGILERTPGSAPARAEFNEWSILGDPVDASGASELVGAQRELDALAAMHPGSRLVGAATFDRAAMAAALATKRPLHLATHLRAAPVEQDVREARLARAGFVLSRGDLFDAEEIRRARPALPLAVLSACETGSGQFIDAEASVGVARAFLESGTRNLLVTLWAVEDNAAREYALAFHRALGAGKSPSRAAVAARQELRDHGLPMSEWAAFRLVGRD